MISIDCDKNITYISWNETYTGGGKQTIKATSNGLIYLRRISNITRGSYCAKFVILFQFDQPITWFQP